MLVKDLGIEYLPPPLASTWTNLAITAVVVVVIGLWLSAMVLYFRLDRKWSIKRGKTKGTEGKFPASVSTRVIVPPEVAVQIAKDAIKRIGGREVEQLDAYTVMGWIGSAFLNVASWGEYQLVVSQRVEPDGSSSLTCSARPRNPMNFIGPGISQRHAERLATEISSLAHSPPGTAETR
jgi:hypothetical protein